MKNIPDMIKMAPMAIDCPDAGCDFGENNAKYKTPVMEPALAMDLMKIQGQSHQQVQGAASAASGPVSNRNMRERQKKPAAGMEISERSSGISGQDIVDDLVLCLSDELRLEVTSEVGDSLEAIMEEDLIEAIKRMLSWLVIQWCIGTI